MYLYGLVVSGTFAGLLNLGFCLLLGWCLVALCCFVGLVRFPGTFLVFRMVWMWDVGFPGHFALGWGWYNIAYL